MPKTSPALGPLDRALVYAAIAFEGQNGGDRIWHRFSPAWRDRLRRAWSDELARGVDSQAAREALARDQADEARPDPDRIHSSWWQRALQEESPAVQAAVLEHVSEPLRSILHEGQEPEAPRLSASLAPHPEALQWALALWSERLVGGSAVTEGDPMVVAILTQRDSRELARWIASVALAKWSFVLAAGGEPIQVDPFQLLKPRQLERLGRFRDHWKAPDPRAARLGRLDLEHHVKGDASEGLQKLGLVTFARLLAELDPHRLRWVLQHLPYPVARFLRSRTGLRTPFIHGRELVAWEESLFQAARDLLVGDQSSGDSSEAGAPRISEGDSD